MAAPPLNAFQIGIVCPLPIERAATQEVLDIEYDDPKERYPNDTNIYSLGKIGHHNVVIAGFPAGFTGLVAAATVASNLTKTFTSVKVLLCVGIGGGVWTETNDVRIGDIVVSEPAGGYGGVEQYNFGKARENGNFERTGIQRPPPEELLTAMGKLKSDFVRERTDLATTIANFRRKRAFRYLGADNDRLFKTGSTHKANSPDCAECDSSQLVKRTPREPPFVEGLPVPQIHYGLIASADQLMQDSQLRDSLNMSCGGHIRCFEMEAAGLMNNFPCLVIRGISDYCDSHKRSDKGWHGFAAAMAAAYARELVRILPVNALAKERTLAKIAIKAGPLQVIPFARNKDFVGRQRHIDWLITKFHTENRYDGCIYAALSGLGGVGKTNIALQLAFCLREKLPDCSIFWVQASDAVSFENSYREIGRQFQIPGIDNDKADVKRLVYKVMSEVCTPWLMVVDNADDSDVLLKADEKTGQQVLFNYIPNSHNGMILFTTRDDKAATDYAGINVMTVNEMVDPEAKELLTKSLRDTSLVEDKAGTKRLLQLLFNIPLAIKQAAAYLNKNKTTIAKYLSAYEETNEGIIKLLSFDFEDKGRYRGMKNPIATTWLISFEQIRKHDPLAVQYMAFMSCIHNQDIQESLLPPAAPDETIQALGTLQAFAFINKRLDGECYDMHGLVHLVLQNWLKLKKEWDNWTITTLRRMHGIFPRPKHENRAIWTGYQIHAQRILTLTNYRSESSIEWCNLASYIGECLLQLGNYQQAEGWDQDTLKLRRQVLGVEHPGTLDSMNSLALVLDKQGKYEVADKIFRQTLELRKKVLGVEHPDTLDSMNNLARILDNRGKYEAAEKILRQTLGIRKKVLGFEHPDTLDSMKNLALVLDNQGKYEAAEEIQRRTLELKEKVLGVEHPSTLDSMNNLALVLDNQGKYEAAEEIHRQTLELKEKVLGVEHPDTLGNMNNLGLVLDNQGKYKAAEEIHRKTLELKEKVLGVEHPSTLGSMDNLGMVLNHQGEYEAAEEIHRKILKLREKVLGVEHPSTLESKNNLGLVLNNQGKYEAAEEIHRQTLELREKLLGVEHPDTLDSNNSLGLVLNNLGKYEAAEKILRQTLGIREKVLGFEHPHTLASMENLAKLLKQQGAS
ncbi:hypothetical protein BP5796_01693 [Coleophoma crateriformis]|uniref:Nucleoside phosphorylase domain-containing protein n=1 Tax=Coleophoma crateriformis TaxID=565419 RepID=A0A3D8T1C2_9HELO|nr:hypothetical protein BP5796_01693 [Coleophoma crateriformis]